jgi:hypothetical protein
MVDWHSKAHFWPLNQRCWNVFVQDLAQYPFAGSIADFETHWQFPRKFHHPMIKDRHAGFEGWH